MEPNPIVVAALQATHESAPIDFKAEFDINSAKDWCEIIKDIVALANTDGGVIVFGADDFGTPTGYDVTPVLELDPVKITDKIRKYTGINFADFSIVEAAKDSHTLAILIIEPRLIPIVFTKPGTYSIGGTKQDRAFSAGVLYVRSGAKSDLATNNDIAKIVRRNVDDAFEKWKENIRKVIEAPLGSNLAIIAPENLATVGETSVSFRIVDDLNAPSAVRIHPDVAYPYRQTELVEGVNAALRGEYVITSYDIQAVRSAYGTDDNPEYCLQQHHSSPRYSEAFAHWIVDNYWRDSTFFSQARYVYQEILRSR